MKTKVYSIDAEGLICAREIILKGGVVAFPTETVYGLGADALNPSAVQKIFEAKGRPADNPLIVHVGDVKAIYEIADEIPPDAEKVINAFMPGPLTVVLKKNPRVPDIVTAGLGTVAVRMPASKEAQAFLKTVGVPVAAPSANASTRPSPTRWQHVVDDLDGKIPLVLKGSDCEIGIESTVLDFSREEITILRPGAVTPSQIGEVLGKPVKVAEKFDGNMNSPGIRYKHYAPDCEVWLNTDGDTEKIKRKQSELTANGKKTEVLTFGADDKESAKRIFALLRDAEKRFDAVVVVWESKTEFGLSVLDRLMRSSQGRTV